MRSRARILLPILFVGAVALPLATAGVARATDAPSAAGHPAAKSDGGRYPIAGFEVHYAEDHPRHPSLDDILAADVTLGRVDDGYVAPRDGIPEAKIALRAAPYTYYYASAIRSINEQLVKRFNDRGLIGVLVQPLETDLEPGTGRDLRTPGQRGLTLVVRTGRVEEVRTFAAGERFEGDERLNAPQHHEIAEDSPARPDSEKELMMRGDLERYTARLNRHPGRRVDVEVSPALKPGGVYLDYMVAEYKPWYAYVQASNLGTEGTTEYRQRFGFTHTQLTNHDDILRLDYVTGNFDKIHAAVGDYEAPVFGFDFDGRLRWRAFGNWSEYESSILGFGEISSDRFDGQSWTAGLQLIANVLQFDELFVDVFAGARWMNVEANNKLSTAEGKDDFFIPKVGFLVERRTDTSYFRLNMSYERNIASVAGTSNEEIENLGRQEVSRNFDMVRADMQLAFYLEPLLFRRGYQDPSTWWSSTLAHEIYLGFRGQQSLGKRLIPNEVMTAGGLYSVRGYPEAATYGDHVYMGTVEYRLHIPRLLRPRAQEASTIPLLGDFRGRPQYVYGRPDWDLILRVFTEAAKTRKVDDIPGEHDDTLWGAGVGLELLLKRNISVRFDAAQALSRVKGSANTIHDNSREYRWLITILY